MIAEKQHATFVDAAAALASDQTPGLDLPIWLSTGMGAVPAQLNTADPAALVWRGSTMPQPLTLVTWGSLVVRRGPDLREDLSADGITHHDLAAWARSMMGGEAPDMLDM